MAKKRKYERTSNAPYCPEHQSWTSMWQRCINPKNRAYPRYGGRGITVCERWKNFFAFAADMGMRPEGTSLDRIENDGNYEPGNCRWATDQEQVENRSCTIWITIDGVRKPLTSWCRIFGVERDVVKHRCRSNGGDWLKALQEATRNLNDEAMIRVTINGETKTAREWCRIRKVRFGLAHQRVVRDGLTWEEAIDRPKIHQKDRSFPKTIKVTINGKTQSIRQWCKELSVTKSAVWKRMKSRGMTAKDALLAEKKINQHK